MQFIRDHIVGRAASHKADADDRGVERVDIAAADRLQRQHDLRADHKGVGAEMRMRRVRTAALDADIPPIGGGEQRTRFCCDLTDTDAGLVVDREDRIARKLVEQPFFDHHSATTAALFGWLKDQMHGAFEIAGRCEVLGGAEQHRRVSVVAAGACILPSWIER